MSEAEALGYLIQVAEGLHEAHKNGIIHRDLRPDNILLTMDGQAKITDLGLSKDLDSDLELTRDNHGLGTPNFIAPEQFGDAKHAGVRCDIYSLGATLYMAVTGQLPFDGANIAAILKMKLADDLLSPRKLIPSLSEHVDFAIRRATLADPARGLASCPEFLAALSGEAKGSAAKASAKRAGPSGGLSAAAKLDARTADLAPLRLRPADVMHHQSLAARNRGGNRNPDGRSGLRHLGGRHRPVPDTAFRARDDSESCRCKRKGRLRADPGGVRIARHQGRRQRLVPRGRIGREAHQGRFAAVAVGHKYRLKNNFPNAVCCRVGRA